MLRMKSLVLVTLFRNTFS